MSSIIIAGDIAFRMNFKYISSGNDILNISIENNLYVIVLESFGMMVNWFVIYFIEWNVFKFNFNLFCIKITFKSAARMSFDYCFGKLFIRFFGMFFSSNLYNNILVNDGSLYIIVVVLLMCVYV